MPFPNHRRVLITLLTLTGALVTCVAVAATAPFDDLRHQQPIHGDAAAGHAKAATCAACHGQDGIATAPTFPSLAGQSATYLYVQLRAFKDGSRSNAVMQPLVKGLDDADMRNLAAYYAAKSAKAASPQDESSAGRTLYHDGNAAQGVPACQGCHGSDARGPHPDLASTMPQPPWSTFPALAAQGAPYLEEQLKAYRDGTRVGTSNSEIMRGVAANLSDADIQALAAYLSSR